VLLQIALDNQNLLRALEVFVVVLIWLFFFRVIRAVWVEVRPPKRWRMAEVDAAADVVAEPRGRRGAKNHLKVIEPGDLRGRTYDVPEEATLGRAAGCRVQVEDAYTSNIHARMFRRDGELWVEDLGSTNGTWVNGERIATPARLGRGDLVQVGGTVFEVTR
jgi:FHA domain